MYKNYLRNLSKFYNKGDFTKKYIDNLVLYSTIYGVSPTLIKEIRKIDSSYFYSLSLDFKILIWVREFSTGLINLYDGYSIKDNIFMKEVVKWVPKYRQDTRHR
ncbi:hypothetical protein [Miniphocaeibacter halophilus]|uniref:Uncharacterized protein n=1 Tax=Miniphocaeibacter halophilus TaxID=2931922 RepID=A0AC61MSV4_9FIRM|nr:hypothetical protein [Miniphocaeibacter halophilus]QQK07301.1 hypothetical protein JFY71_08230 [Miniphocaeibacter halophilus]